MSLNQHYVWWSSKDSRKNQTLSLLATGETIFAVALYWVIAVYWDTHIHLITSLFIAPLLLLRSEQSIKKGVEWFLADLFGVKNFDSWSKLKRSIWIIGFALLVSSIVFAVIYPLAQIWLVGQQGWLLFGYSTLLGVLGVLLAFTFAVAAAAAVVGAGAGYSIRAIAIRLIATVRYLCPGIKRLPYNWWANNFVIDSHTTPELLPDIGKKGDYLFSLDGLLDNMKRGFNLQVQFPD